MYHQTFSESVSRLHGAVFDAVRFKVCAREAHSSFKFLADEAREASLHLINFSFFFSVDAEFYVPRFFPFPTFCFTYECESVGEEKTGGG